MFSTSFPEKSVISRITAKMLIEVEAVRFSAKEPLSSLLVGQVQFTLIVEN